MSAYAQKAGFWIRFAAVFVDGIVTSIFSVPGYIALNMGEKETYQCDADKFENSTGNFLCERPTGSAIATSLVLAGLGLIAGIVYYAILEGRGATVGKRVCGIRVVDARTGQPIGTGRAIGRYFARIISALVCYLGYLWMLWDPEKQTWHDKMVSSVVVKS